MKKVYDSKYSPKMGDATGNRNGDSSVCMMYVEEEQSVKNGLFNGLHSHQLHRKMNYP